MIFIQTASHVQTLSTSTARSKKTTQKTHEKRNESMQLQAQIVTKYTFDEQKSQD